MSETVEVKEIGPAVTVPVVEVTLRLTTQQAKELYKLTSRISVGGTTEGWAYTLFAHLAGFLKDDDYSFELNGIRMRIGEDPAADCGLISFP